MSEKSYLLAAEKDLEATSAIVLSSPAIDSAIVRHISRSRARYAIPLTNRPPTMLCFEASLVTHDTAGVLSQKAAACLWRRSETTCSSASCWSTTPAHSRSDIDMPWRRSIRRTMSGGHWTRQMNGARSEFGAGSHTPPTPVPHASQ